MWNLARTTGAILMTLTAVSCAPNATSLETQELDATSTRTLLHTFEVILAEKNITLKTTTGYQYGGTDTTAFKQVINRFYQNHPGFCPIEDAFFMAEQLPGVYMTITSNDQNVALLIYDQRKNPTLSYVIAEGQANPPLPSTRCTNRTR